MAITITLPRTVSLADHLRVEALVSTLRNQEGDFKGRAISLAQGSSTFVVDSQDGLRGALLQLMVESVLEDADESLRASQATPQLKPRYANHHPCGAHDARRRF